MSNDIFFRIDDSWVIKVADFGLSKNAGTKDYFRQDEASGAKLPVKWMALESLQEGVFSEKTDVVSISVISLWGRGLKICCYGNHCEL